MARSPLPGSHLKLVGAESSIAGDSAVQRSTSADWGVVKENRLAAHAGSFGTRSVDTRDPRWLLARQTQTRLQGAVLTPERREELMVSGRRLGLRPFECSLVIAVVQDRARQDPLGRQSEVRHPIRSTDPPAGLPMARHGWTWWIAAVTCAMTLAAVVVRWLAAQT